ncbi:MAG: hypothetical protein PHI79_05735, partial [Sulfurovaceae bacterium]|nr:hypothetical protein [Sulfurovaceae bacterium]
MKNKRVYTAIANAIEKCGKEHGFHGRKHIAQAIGLQGNNADKQLSAILNTTSYNPANPKRMSIDMFIDIAYELDDNFTLMMLNALAEEFGFCVSKQKDYTAAETGTKQIYISVLELAHEHGELSHAINESLK